jgi:diketogulonate reductase-like aldo/keto reductase
MRSLTLKSTIELHNGVEIPALGLGVFQSAEGSETQRAVRDALAAGYRHIDTARIYRNEADVGAAIRASDVPRDEIFVTTKLWNSDHGYDAALRAFDASLDRLGLAHVELYLIHWPVRELRRETWRAMEKIVASGRCRSIGVSNYMIPHLRELIDAGATVPMVNQVEFSPYLYQRELLEFCTRHRIVVEAYSPLTRGRKLKDKKLQVIADRYGKSPAQLLIRWALQHGTVVLPKSVHPARIRENADVFDFEVDENDMTTLDAMNENLHTGWDPTNEP